jgi:hypothetical protein
VEHACSVRFRVLLLIGLLTGALVLSQNSVASRVTANELMTAPVASLLVTPSGGIFRNISRL